MKFSLERQIYNTATLGLIILMITGAISFWSISRLVAATEREKQLLVQGKLQQDDLVLLEQWIEAESETLLVVSGGSLLTGLGAVVALFIIHLNITKRKQFEVALQQSEARFRTTFEESPMGLVLTDLQGGIFTSNLAFQKLLGYSAAELQQMTIIQLTYPDDVAETTRLFQELVKGERQAYHLEKRYSCKDSQIIWGRISASLVRDNQGQPLFVVGMIEDISERKQIEQELQKLSRAVEQSASTVVITDTQGYIEYANPRFTETTGYTLTEATRQHIRLLKSGQTPLETYQQLWETITADKEWRGELCNRKKNGELYWESTTISPLKNTQGIITHFLTVKEDTTERKQAEEALRQSREKYRLVVDNVKEVIFQIDAGNRFTFLNAAWTEIMGYSLKECLETSYFDYIHPDDREPIAGFFQAVWDQDLDYCRHTCRFIAQSGRVCWIEVYAKLIQAGEETPLGISGTLNDITDRKRAEQALQASETRFRTLTTHAPVGILETDAQGGSKFVNQYWCELTGLTSAESLGQGWIKALHPDDREHILAEWITAAQADQGFAGEFRLQTPGGKVAWVSGKAIVLHDEVGEITGYLGTIADITESKQMREQLAHDAAQLMLINDVGSRIAAVLDLDQVLDRAAYLVHDIFGYHHVALFLLDSGVARLKAIAGSYTAYFPPNHTQELDQGIIGWVAIHGEKVVANDVSQEPRYMSKIADKTVTRAELCLPIQVAGQTVGVLDIQSPHFDTFTDNDVILMKTLVDQIALAIENARLYQAVQLELVERKQTEEALRESEQRSRSLFENMLDGYAYCQILFESDQPQDFIYLDVNTAFETLTGLKQVVGKKVSEVIPGLKESDPELFEIYRRFFSDIFRFTALQDFTIVGPETSNPLFGITFDDILRDA